MNHIKSPFAFQAEYADCTISALNQLSLVCEQDNIALEFERLINLAITAQTKAWAGDFDNNDRSRLLLFTLCAFFLLKEDHAIIGMRLLLDKYNFKSCPSASAIFEMELLDPDKIGGSSKTHIMLYEFAGACINEKGKFEVVRRSKVYKDLVGEVIDLKRSSSIAFIKLLFSYAMTSATAEEAVFTYQLMNELFEPADIHIYSGTLINSSANFDAFYSDSRNHDLDFLLTHKEHYDTSEHTYLRNLALFFTHTSPSELNPLSLYLFAMRNKGGQRNTLTQMYEQIAILNALSLSEIVKLLDPKSNTMLKSGLDFIMSTRNVRLTDLLGYADEVIKLKITEVIAKTLSKKPQELNHF